MNMIDVLMIAPVESGKFTVNAVNISMIGSAIIK